MRYIVFKDQPERHSAIKEAAEVIKNGGIVACPTETYYALCARFDNEDTLKYLFMLKGRHSDKPFPLIIGWPELLSFLTEEVNELSRELIRKFWPGPLTILFNAKKGLSEFLLKDGKVAVRVPGHSPALELAMAAGIPLTATSGNNTGFPPSQTAQDVMKYFDARIDMLLDEGVPTPGELPSTIVDPSDGRLVIIREGAVSLADLSKLVNK